MLFPRLVLMVDYFKAQMEASRNVTFTVVDDNRW